MQGPSTFTIEINRNYSFNTILAGLFLDQTDELPAPYLEKWEDYNNPQVQTYFETVHLAHSSGALNDAEPGIECLEKLRILENQDPTLFCSVQRKAYLCLAAYLANKMDKGDANVIKAYRECLYHLHLFNAWDSLILAEFGKTPRSIERSIRMQADVGGCGNGREIVERYAGYKSINLDLRQAPKNNKLTSLGQLEQ